MNRIDIATAKKEETIQANHTKFLSSLPRLKAGSTHLQNVTTDRDDLEYLDCQATMHILKLDR